MQSRPRYLLIAVAILLIGLIVWYLKTIVLYIIIAIIISLIGQPLVRLFSRLKIGKFSIPIAVSAFLALVTMVFFLGLLVSMFIPLLIEQVEVISRINSTEITNAFKVPLENLNYDLQKYHIDYGNGGGSFEQNLAAELTSFFGFKEISLYLQGAAGFTGSLIGGAFSVLFMSFFFMKDDHLIYNSVLLLTPPKHIEGIKQIMQDTKRLLTRYFIGILFDMLFVATLTAIALSLLGIRNALLIGMFAGLMNVIPYIGPLIGAAFGILIGVTSNLNLEFYTQLLPLTGKIAIVFLIVQLLDSMVFQPLVISNIVKAHPLEIFLVILIAGSVAGISGMIVAVPVYTIIRIIAKEFLNNFKVVQKLTADLEE